MPVRFPLGHPYFGWSQLVLAVAVLGLGACEQADSPTDATPILDEPASFTTTATGLLFDDPLGNFTKWSTEGCAPGTCPWVRTIVSSPSRIGSTAARMELRRNDPMGSCYNCSKRSEITNPRLTGWTRDANGPFKAGDEAWFGFSIYIPGDWINDAAYTPGGGEILFQLHEQPDYNNWSKNRTSFLRLIAEAGNFRWITYASACSASDACWTAVPRMGGKADGQMDYIGPMKKGGWTDWVIHAKWSYGSDGLLEIWRDGNKVATKLGPNAYKTMQPGFVKMGIYKWSWSNTSIGRRVVGYDAMRIAGKGGSYSMVAPR